MIDEGFAILCCEQPALDERSDTILIHLSFGRFKWWFLFDFFDFSIPISATLPVLYKDGCSAFSWLFRNHIFELCYLTIRESNLSLPSFFETIADFYDLFPEIIEFSPCLRELVLFSIIILPKSSWILWWFSFSLLIKRCPRNTYGWRSRNISYILLFWRSRINESMNRRFCFPITEFVVFIGSYWNTSPRSISSSNPYFLIWTLHHIKDHISFSNHRSNRIDIDSTCCIRYFAHFEEGKTASVKRLLHTCRNLYIPLGINR